MVKDAFVFSNIIYSGSFFNTEKWCSGYEANHTNKGSLRWYYMMIEIMFRNRYQDSRSYPGLKF